MRQRLKTIKKAAILVMATSLLLQNLPLLTDMAQAVSFSNGDTLKATGFSWTNGNITRAINGTGYTVYLQNTSSPMISIESSQAENGYPPGSYLFTPQETVPGNGVNTTYANDILHNSQVNSQKGYTFQIQDVTTGLQVASGDFALSDMDTLSGYYVSNPQQYYRAGSIIQLGKIPQPTMGIVSVIDQNTGLPASDGVNPGDVLTVNVNYNQADHYTESPWAGMGGNNGGMIALLHSASGQYNNSFAQPGWASSAGLTTESIPVAGFTPYFSSYDAQHNIVAYTTGIAPTQSFEIQVPYGATTSYKLDTWFVDFADRYAEASTTFPVLSPTLTLSVTPTSSQTTGRKFTLTANTTNAEGGTVSFTQSGSLVNNAGPGTLSGDGQSNQTSIAYPAQTAESYQYNPTAVSSQAGSETVTAKLSMPNGTTLSQQVSVSWTAPPPAPALTLNVTPTSAQPTGNTFDLTANATNAAGGTVTFAQSGSLYNGSGTGTLSGDYQSHEASITYPAQTSASYLYQPTATSSVAGSETVTATLRVPGFVAIQSSVYLMWNRAVCTNPLTITTGNGSGVQQASGSTAHVQVSGTSGDSVTFTTNNGMFANGQTSITTTIDASGYASETLTQSAGVSSTKVTVTDRTQAACAPAVVTVDWPVCTQPPDFNSATGGSQTATSNTVSVQVAGNPGDTLTLDLSGATFSTGAMTRQVTLDAYGYQTVTVNRGSSDPGTSLVTIAADSNTACATSATDTINWPGVPSVTVSITPASAQFVGSSFTVTAHAVNVAPGDSVTIMESGARFPGTIGGLTSQTWTSPGTYASYRVNATVNSSQPQTVTYTAWITDASGDRYTAPQPVSAQWISNVCVAPVFTTPSPETPSGSTATVQVKGAAGDVITLAVVRGTFSTGGTTTQVTLDAYGYGSVTVDKGGASTSTVSITADSNPACSSVGGNETIDWPGVCTTPVQYTTGSGGTQTAAGNQAYVQVQGNPNDTVTFSLSSGTFTATGTNTLTKSIDPYGYASFYVAQGAGSASVVTLASDSNPACATGQTQQILWPVSGPGLTLSVNNNAPTLGVPVTLTATASGNTQGGSIVIEDLSGGNTISGTNQYTGAAGATTVSTEAHSAFTRTVQYEAYVIVNGTQYDSNLVTVTWSGQTATIDLTASATQLYSGQSAVLTYTVSGAQPGDYVDVSSAGNGIDEWKASGLPDTTDHYTETESPVYPGSVTVSAVAILYNDLGQPVSQSGVTMTWKPPVPTITITATPNQLMAGQPATIAYAVNTLPSGDTVKVQGVGGAHPWNVSGQTAYSESDQQVEMPGPLSSITTYYTAYIVNPYGQIISTATASATWTNAWSNQPVTLSARPTQLGVGSPTTLTATTTQTPPSGYSVEIFDQTTGQEVLDSASAQAQGLFTLDGAYTDAFIAYVTDGYGPIGPDSNTVSVQWTGVKVTASPSVLPAGQTTTVTATAQNMATGAWLTLVNQNSGAVGAQAQRATVSDTQVEAQALNDTYVAYVSDTSSYSSAYAQSAPQVVSWYGVTLTASPTHLSLNGTTTVTATGTNIPSGYVLQIVDKTTGQSLAMGSAGQTTLRVTQSESQITSQTYVGDVIRPPIYGQGLWSAFYSESAANYYSTSSQPYRELPMLNPYPGSVYYGTNGQQYPATMENGPPGFGIGLYENGKWVTIPNPNGDANVTAVKFDPATGDVWAGTASSGTAYWDGTEWGNTGSPGGSGSYVTQFLYDTVTGAMWALSYNPSAGTGAVSFWGGSSWVTPTLPALSAPDMAGNTVLALPQYLTVGPNGAVYCLQEFPYVQPNTYDSTGVWIPTSGNPIRQEAQLDLFSGGVWQNDGTVSLAFGQTTVDSGSIDVNALWTYRPWDITGMTYNPTSQDLVFLVDGYRIYHNQTYNNNSQQSAAIVSGMPLTFGPQWGSAAVASGQTNPPAGMVWGSPGPSNLFASLFGTYGPYGGTYSNEVQTGQQNVTPQFFEGQTTDGAVLTMNGGYFQDTTVNPQWNAYYQDYQFDSSTGQYMFYADVWNPIYPDISTLSSNAWQPVYQQYDFYGYPYYVQANMTPGATGAHWYATVDGSQIQQYAVTQGGGGTSTWPIFPDGPPPGSYPYSGAFGGTVTDDVESVPVFPTSGSQVGTITLPGSASAGPLAFNSNTSQDGQPSAPTLQSLPMTVTWSGPAISLSISPAVGPVAGGELLTAQVTSGWVPGSMELSICDNNTGVCFNPTTSPYQTEYAYEDVPTTQTFTAYVSMLSGGTVTQKFAYASNQVIGTWQQVCTLAPNPVLAQDGQTRALVSLGGYVGDTIHVTVTGGTIAGTGGSNTESVTLPPGGLSLTIDRVPGAATATVSETDVSNHACGPGTLTYYWDDLTDLTINGMLNDPGTPWNRWSPQNPGANQIDTSEVMPNGSIGHTYGNPTPPTGQPNVYVRVAGAFGFRLLWTGNATGALPASGTATFTMTQPGAPAARTWTDRLLMAPLRIVGSQALQWVSDMTVVRKYVGDPAKPSTMQLADWSLTGYPHATIALTVHITLTNGHTESFQAPDIAQTLGYPTWFFIHAVPVPGSKYLQTPPSTYSNAQTIPASQDVPGANANLVVPHP